MTPAAPVVYIVACEPSADALGTQLMAGLRAETQGRVRFAGIGGPRMVAAGFTSLFDPRELALLGILHKACAGVEDRCTARGPQLCSNRSPREGANL